MGKNKKNSYSGGLCKCSVCNGVGWIWDYNISENMEEKTVCYECDGKGYVEADE